MEQEKGTLLNVDAPKATAKMEAYIADATAKLNEELERSILDKVDDRVAKGIVRVVDALEQQLNSAYRRIFELEQHFSKYDRVFEAMFKEELDRRVNGTTQGMGSDGVSISPLHRLKFEMQNESSNKAGRAE